MRSSKSTKRFDMEKKPYYKECVKKERKKLLINQRQIGEIFEFSFLLYHSVNYLEILFTVAWVKYSSRLVNNKEDVSSTNNCSNKILVNYYFVDTLTNEINLYIFSIKFCDIKLYKLLSESDYSLSIFHFV